MRCVFHFLSLGKQPLVLLFGRPQAAISLRTADVRALGVARTVLLARNCHGMIGLGVSWVAARLTVCPMCPRL